MRNLIPRVTEEARRELKRSIDKFSIKVVKHVDKDWWDSLTKDRTEVYHSWNNYIRSEYYRVMIPSSEVIDKDFETWIKKIKSEVKPNTSLYRDKKIDRILND